MPSARRASAAPHADRLNVCFGETRPSAVGRGCVKTQIAMPFGRSSTITLIKRIEYRAICAVEVCAFGKIFEFSHRLGRTGTVNDQTEIGRGCVKTVASGFG